jgi:hypothetical protein
LNCFLARAFTQLLKLFLIPSLTLATFAAAAVPASALTQTFPFEGDRDDGDYFSLLITTNDALTTASFPSHNNVAAGLISPAYTFTGYQITAVSGFYRPNGGSDNPITGLKPVGSIVENSPNNSPPGNDTSPHSPSDNLYNPNGGFSVSLGLQGGGVSYGGFVFTVDESGTPEDYQLYTDPVTGRYAGCPGSCVRATRRVPGPLPLIGLAATLGYSRKLKVRFKAKKESEALSGNA